MQTDNPPLIELYRDGALESIHRGAWVLAGPDGIMLQHRGAPGQLVFARSAMKSLQALPLIESGAADRFGFDARHLALALASHSGERRHIEVASDGLAKIGLDPEHLQCGPQRPLHAAPSVEATRLANNCSGKHVGFLATAVHRGQDPADYLDAEGPTQHEVRSAVETMTGYEVRTGAVDGCSAPTFAMPLVNLATGLARLTNPSSLGSDRTTACTRLTDAAGQHPDLIAGTHERFCTDLIAATDGRVVGKIGAEGVYVFGVIGEGVGFAGKVDDGNARGLYPVMLHLLAQRGLITANELRTLDRWGSTTIRNWGGLHVGRIEICSD